MFRKLRTESGTYLWRVGHSVLVFTPSGQRLVLSPADIIGVSQHEYELSKHNGTSSGMVTPGNLKQWLINNKL